MDRNRDLGLYEFNFMNVLSEELSRNTETHKAAGGESRLLLLSLKKKPSNHNLLFFGLLMN